MHSRKTPQNEDPRTNCVPVWQGLLIVITLVALIAGALAWLHTPEPHTPAMGSFQCDHSGRLPCD